MTPEATAEAVSAHERGRLAETISAWNRCCDSRDLEGLRRLTTVDPRFSYEEVRYEGPHALAAFAAAHGSTDEVARRTHTNHLQAWRTADGFRVRTLTMIVHLVGVTSPFGDGAPSVGWVGYAEDLVREDAGVLRIAQRRLERWGGPILGRFPGMGGRP